jgi:ubiquinol-cytochrome c reductase iron-sulfur subunit
MGGDTASKIPDFSHYRSKQGSNSNLVFQYFMVGTMGALTAVGAKATVQGMWISRDGGNGSGGAAGH